MFSDAEGARTIFQRWLYRRIVEGNQGAEVVSGFALIGTKKIKISLKAYCLCFFNCMYASLG